MSVTIQSKPSSNETISNVNRNGMRNKSTVIKRRGEPYTNVAYIDKYRLESFCVSRLLGVLVHQSKTVVWLRAIAWYIGNSKR